MSGMGSYRMEVVDVAIEAASAEKAEAGDAGYIITFGSPNDHGTINVSVDRKNALDLVAKILHGEAACGSDIAQKILQDFAAIIRAAIAKSGKSQYALREETGISQGRIGAFIRGGSMRLEHASKIAAAVGLELRPKRRRVPRKLPTGEYVAGQHRKRSAAESACVAG